MKTRLVRLVVLAAWLLSVCLPVSASISYDTWPGGVSDPPRPPSPHSLLPGDMPPGDTCTWTGVVSDDWNTGGNWSCGHVPSPNDAAIIPPTVRQPRINASGDAATVAINGSARLTLGSGSSLTVANGLALDQAAELRPGLNSTITLQNGNWTNSGAGVVSDGLWTLIFDGLGNQGITGYMPTQAFGNLTLRNMSMGLPLFNVGANVNQLNIGGTLTLGDATSFNAGTAGVGLRGNWLNNGGSFQGSGVVTFQGGNDQIIGGSAPTHTFPGPVTVDKTAGTVVLGDGADGLDISGPLSVVHGALDLRGNDLTTHGTTTVTAGRLNLNGGAWATNGTVTLGSGGVFAPGSGTVILGNGDWTNNGGTVEEPLGLWTLQINGPGDQWINGTAATQHFGNLTLSNPTMGMPEVQFGGRTATANIAGTLTFGPETTLTTGTLHNLGLGADLINNGGSFVGSTLLNIKFNGAGPQVIGGTAPSQYIPGNLWVEGPGPDHTMAFGGSTTQLTVNGAFEVIRGAFNLGANTLTTRGPADILESGTLNLGSGVWNSLACIYLATGGTLNPGSATVNFRGGTFGFYDGTIGPGNWTANFQLAGNQIIGGTGVATFHNINISNNTMGPATLSIGSSGHGPSALSATGDVTIGDSTELDAGTASTISVGGNWRNDGVFLPGSSIVTFNGSAPLRGRSLAAVQTIGGEQPTTFNGLTIDNPSGVLLGSSQRVSGALDLRVGDLTTAAYTLTLGSAAVVTGTHEVVGAVQRTQTFTAGVPYSFGQPNLTLTFAAVGELAGVAVNAQKIAPDGLRPAISRTVTILPTGGGYTATLRLPYQEAELNGIPEADLRLWRRGDDRWATQGPQNANAAENWVEQSRVTAFSTWTLASVNASQGSRLHLPLIVRH